MVKHFGFRVISYQSLGVEVLGVWGMLAVSEFQGLGVEPRALGVEGFGVGLGSQSVLLFGPRPFSTGRAQ